MTANQSQPDREVTWAEMADALGQLTEKSQAANAAWRNLPPARGVHTLHTLFVADGGQLDE